MKILQNQSLLAWNTFHIDVQADIFAEYDNINELCTLLQRYNSLPMLHIGRGSNLLFTNNFNGIILHSNICFYHLNTQTEEEVLLEVGAGVVFDDFIRYAVEHDWGGAENLSYIPGEVGASAVQNIGAYGVEVKDIIHRVFTINRQTLEPRIFTNQECQYAYRDSIFKNEMKNQYIVTSVEFKLTKQPRLSLDYGNLRAALADIAKPDIADVRRTVTAIRQQKLPEVAELGSAGSFFKNPVIDKQHFDELRQLYPTIPHYPAPNGVKIPAAWLIEQCGWKGKTLGGAQVYDKQPLVIVNKNNATPKDIVTLADNISRSIKEKFSISIYPEVNYI